MRNSWVQTALVFGLLALMSSCASTETIRSESTLPDGLKSVKIDEIPVVYTDQGEGDLLIVLPSYPFGTRHWNEFAGHMSASMRVIVIEPPGFRDPRSMKANFSSEHFLQIYRKFFRTLRLKKAHVVGLGEGGALAVAFGHHFPEHILTSISINGFEALPWTPEVRPGIDLTYGTKDKEIGRLLSLATLRFSQDPLSKNDLKDFLDLRKLDGYADTARDRKAGLIQDLRAAYIPSMIESIYFPTLLIHSENDDLLPKKFVERSHQVIPGSEIRTLGDTGHFAFLDNPEELAIMILAFIKNNPGINEFE